MPFAVGGTKEAIGDGDDDNDGGDGDSNQGLEERQWKETREKRKGRKEKVRLSRELPSSLNVQEENVPFCSPFYKVAQAQ